MTAHLCVPALLSDPLFAEASRITNPSAKCKPVVVYQLTTTEASPSHNSTSANKATERAASPQNLSTLRAVFLWDPENANAMVDEFILPNEGRVSELHHSLVAAVKGLNSQRLDDNNQSKPLCSISVHVPVSQLRLITALENLGWLPLAYLPSLVGSTSTGREDVVRLNFFPDAKECTELAKQICTMASPAVKSPAHNCTNHVIFHTIKQALAEACNIQDSPIFQRNPVVHPWPRSVPVWPWRQLGWEDMVEEAWMDIKDELLTSMHQAQAVKVSMLLIAVVGYVDVVDDDFWIIGRCK
jgi:hypothetical protein